MDREQGLFAGFGLTFEEKVAYSLMAIKEFEPKTEPYYGCFSGGKDSVIIKHLVSRTSVKIDWHYNVTTIDAPELVHFIRDHHKDVKWERPEMHLCTMVVKRGLPTRRMRWCCSYYKERGGIGRTKLTGIRAAESPRRAKQWKVCTHSFKSGWYVNPILYWSDDDVWNYIRDNAIPYCKLYDEGFKRLGCIGCPMNRNRANELKRWPRYEKLWRRAARKRWVIMQEKGGTDRASRTFKNADEWFDWWLSNESMPAEDDCQMGLF
jgi:phosphoadenosine phosphosulfate reductase